MNLKTITLASILLCATAASAFDVDGIHSGMTTQELQELGTHRGLQVWSSGDLNYHMGIPAKYQIDGSFVVCGGRVVSYSRSIDFDADYLNVLTDTIERNGQPNVRTPRLPVFQSPGQYIQKASMVWYLGSQDRIELAFTPETRDGKGALRFTRGASIQYSIRNTCMTDF